jgi:hypothetical protein
LQCKKHPGALLLNYHASKPPILSKTNSKLISSLLDVLLRST